MEKHNTDQCKLMERLVKVNKDRVAKGEPIDFELPFPEQITKEMYYELISKVLSDLRSAVKTQVTEFRLEGNTVMTVQDRDRILSSVDGDQIRGKVLQEFGVDTQGQNAPQIMKHAFYSFSGDQEFKDKVTQIYETHQNKMVQILKTE